MRISNWAVLQSVAAYHADAAADIEKSAANLALVRAGALPLIALDDNPKRTALRLAREEGSQAITRGLERIIGDEANFQDAYVLERLTAMARAVCRISKAGAPIGTGWLVAPDIIITNHHVLGNQADAGDMAAEFDFELDEQKQAKPPVSFRLRPDVFFLSSSLDPVIGQPNSGLDFTLVGVEATNRQGVKLSQYSPLRLDATQGKIVKGEACIIVQHPQGLPKKVVLKDNAFFYDTETRIVYESDTLPGSSGAVVIALGTCEVIALHHSGLPKTDDQKRPLTKNGTPAGPDTPDDQIDWLGNEGIRISCIVLAIKGAMLPAAMKARQADLTAYSDQRQQAFAQLVRQTPPTPAPTPPLPEAAAPPSPQPKVATPMPALPTPTNTDFIIKTRNDAATRQTIERYLALRYGAPTSIKLLLPGSARAGQAELFGFTATIAANPYDEAAWLMRIPEVQSAEPDLPTYLNQDKDFLSATPVGTDLTESALIDDVVNDKYGTWNEGEINDRYACLRDLMPAEKRRWTWARTNYDTILKTDYTTAAGKPLVSPIDAGIHIAQFDTGYSDHPKVKGQFDVLQDYDFVDNDPTAEDSLTPGILRQPGHGTRTGSLIVGLEHALGAEEDGNCGLLTSQQVKLVPFRISKSVILIERQAQLAAALDHALSHGFQVITMSMGLPPTLATAEMARKAYDAGVIWCCAAGNEVKAVIAPAVYPGTVAVAASNPDDKPWKGSSFGPAVDITAPGEDVYVPIWHKGDNGDIATFSYGSGTSYATPHVAAAAALWLAMYQADLADYTGWRRVAAFQKALQISARRTPTLPTKGFGHGILDMVALLNTAPPPIDELKYAYDGWDNNAFLALLQGWGEAAHTWWQAITRPIFGVRMGNQESLRAVEAVAVPTAFAQLQSQAVFGTSPTLTESAISVPVSQADALAQFNIIMAQLDKAAR